MKWLQSLFEPLVHGGGDQLRLLEARLLEFCGVVTTDFGVHAPAYMCNAVIEQRILVHVLDLYVTLLIFIF